MKTLFSRVWSAAVFLATVGILLSTFVGNRHAATAQETIKSEHESFRLVPLANGLSRPWSLAFLPNNDILITERTGQLRIFRDNKLDPNPIAGLPPIAVGGQGGLLDIVLHPDFATNNLVYFSYAARGQGGFGTHVARAKFDGTKLSEVDIIFEAAPKTGNRLHYGSRLVFGADNMLYITIGEKFSMQEAQKRSNHLGSVIRIKDDGSIPDDNPFKNDAAAKPEIFSYGHRNAQGMALHPVTKKMWLHEHGPQGGDELNILKAGANFGWPKITYGVNYGGSIITDLTKAPGLEQPVVHWTPSIAPSGMAFYTGDKFPNWKGDLFVGALAHLHLRRLELDGEKVTGQEILLQEFGERIRDVRSGPDGFIYILTDSRNGQLLRLEPS